ncbi:tyrosine-protein phosphatase [Novosphingobium album (ex Liu et al. 2023)]|uniref:Tyrosine-protein phosphatase n=1 Tax=Novosphingobium album (ex Liu et al. 2023) TaxID=3031130 RepID=A0ABT5WN81_9SPHN|nr:tyrosine-protein phosphatase [Novosphingobium album (ex Liu et al. 2023)]MDE8651505.1 tyrosine-protein phosphatase [Novosphingobium album (ex Liu et al. 2023)]
MKRITLLTALPLLAMLAAPAAFAGTIASPTVERVAPDRLVLRWNDKDPVDVLQADRPDADAASATVVSARDRDGTHEVAFAPGAARPYFLLRDSRSGEVVHLAERVLPLQQGSNFRDVGGYPAAGGKHVRWGMIFRSGGQPMLTAADVKEVKQLGIANLIDLRSDEERVLAPTKLDGIPYNAIGYSMAEIMANMTQVGKNPANPMQGMENGYRAFPAQLAPHVRLVFRKLLAKEGPVLYNCSAGQDRTGFTTAMILSALGVPRETIYADYVLSTPSRQPRWELPEISDAMAGTNPIAGFFAKFQKDPAAAKAMPLVTQDGTPFLAFALAEIDSRWGSVDAYLEKEIGLTGADIAALRATYLE